MTTQQEFAGTFENYLQDYMTKLGMTVSRNPKLKDGKKPDFLVEYEGRACYVEATHIQAPDEFKEKRGEMNIRELLERRTSSDWEIVLQYASDNEKRLTDPISKRDKDITQIGDWLSTIEQNPDTKDCNRSFQISGIWIRVDAYSAPTKVGNRVLWIKDASQWGSASDQLRKLRDKLKGKYDWYTAKPDSLGTCPLIIAIFDESTDKEEMHQALYGTETRNDGVWFNARSGKLEVRHNHLVGVWHFPSMRDPRRPAVFLANHYRDDIETIIPGPILDSGLHRNDEDSP